MHDNPRKEGTSNPWKIFLGKKLRQAREKSGMTASDVEDMTGINFSTLSRWENGHNSPPPDKLAELAYVYNVDPSWFWMDEEDAYPELKRKSGMLFVGVENPDYRDKIVGFCRLIGIPVTSC